MRKDVPDRPQPDRPQQEWASLRREPGTVNEQRGRTAGRGRIPSLSLWRNHDYLLWLSGQSVSSLGSQISGVAYPLLALALTGSPAKAGLVGTGSFVSYLVFSFFAGVWVDRLDRCVIMVACEFGQALVSGSIPVAASVGHLTVLHLVVAGFCSTALYIFFDVAGIAALPRVVTPDQLPTAVAQNGVVQSVAQLSGPSIGGIIYQSLGKTIPMLVDAISYAISALSLMSLRTSLQEKQTSAQRHIGREMMEALNWVRRQGLVSSIMLYNSTFFFIMNASRFSLIVIARERGASAAIVGLLLSIGSIGELIGSLIAVRVQQRVHFRHIVLGGFWAFAALCLLCAIAPAPLGLVAVWAGISFVFPLYNTPTFAYQIALIPDDMQGRVQSLGVLAFFGPSTLSAAFAGLLLQNAGPSLTFVIFAVILGLMTLTAICNSAVRTAPEWTDLHSPMTSS